MYYLRSTIYFDAYYNNFLLILTIVFVSLVHSPDILIPLNYEMQQSVLYSLRKQDNGQSITIIQILYEKGELQQGRIFLLRIL